MKDTESALKWIVSILENKRVPFQIAGGFAARLYGSDRELADIDIDIPSRFFETIKAEVKEHIIFGPDQYSDENWDLMLMTLEYKGQVIDIAGESKIFDQNKKEWTILGRDFNNSNQLEVYGIMIPVLKKEALIAYKSKLLREVDKEDIKALKY